MLSQYYNIKYVKLILINLSCSIMEGKQFFIIFNFKNYTSPDTIETTSEDSILRALNVLDKMCIRDSEYSTN